MTILCQRKVSDGCEVVVYVVRDSYSCWASSGIVDCPGQLQKLAGDVAAGVLLIFPPFFGAWKKNRTPVTGI